MPVEGFAEPVAHLRVEAEMLQGAVVRPVVILSIERIQASLDVERPFLGKTELQPRIESSRSPIRDIRLQPHYRCFAIREKVLRVVGKRQAKQQYRQ